LIVAAGWCAVLVAEGCGSDSTGPTPTGPKISCPASQTVQSTDGRAVLVTFPPPTVTGGTSPVVTTCTPLSGSLFAVGTSPVSCATTDADRRSDSCAFQVVVSAPPPRLSVTKFLAFGNSETEGKINTQSDPYGLGDTGPSYSYPSRLKARLQSQYLTQAQAFVITNGGCGGEMVALGDGACTGTNGQLRLQQRLTEYAPDVLLLMEGVNDLNFARESAIMPVVDGLRAMTLDAQRRNVRVIIATLPPERQGGRNGNAWDLIPTVNAHIRAIASQNGAILCDVYQAFGGSPDPWIGPDGLHPTEQGYDKIAETFFLAIQRNLEVKVGPGALALPR
jgi:lysophospholipase L1-like esterase